MLNDSKTDLAYQWVHDVGGAFREDVACADEDCSHVGSTQSDIIMVRVVHLTVQSK